jgi:hypothetical protein
MCDDRTIIDEHIDDSLVFKQHGDVSSADVSDFTSTRSKQSMHLPICFFARVTGDRLLPVDNTICSGDY